MKTASLLAFALCLAAAAVASASASASSFDLKKQVETYKLRYALRDPFTKLVSYEGDGFEDLYGVRNFRVVLNGVYYRGGANNNHNRYTIRSNANPLQKRALRNLCEEGFTEAVYLYSTNFNLEPTTTVCKTKSGAENHLIYRQITALESGNEHQLLQVIYDHIKGKVTGPVYDHCWNGWHASGYVASISLMQFCGYTHAKADEYWVKNTDGNAASHDRVRKKIAQFEPFPEFKISQSERDLICPN